MTVAKLKKNFRDWVDDRAENGEPLMVASFKDFMKNDLGYPAKDIKAALTKDVLEKAKITHKKGLKEYRYDLLKQRYY